MTGARDLGPVVLGKGFRIGVEPLCKPGLFWMHLL